MKTPTDRSSLAIAFAALMCAPTIMAQQEIGYIEEFALAPNRDEALEQLIPGTEDYYHYHALHYQNTRKGNQFGEIMTQWKKRFPQSSRRNQIERREALINYGNDPKGSLEFIRRELGLDFDHQQEGRAAAQDHPAALDQGKIAWSEYLADALRGTEGLKRVKEEAFHALLASGHELTGPQRRDLLSRAGLPDLPGLVDVVVADLKSKESRGFGEFGIHRALTIAQLDELRGKKGDLLRNEAYVHTYLTKLRPGADSNPAAEPAVREAYFDRAWGFVKDLDPAFNSLKAHLLYRRLAHDHARGVHDEGRFKDYIKLPRNVSYLRPEWRREQKDAWRSPADVNRNFAEVTGLAPIGGDEALVRAYLLHFLKDAANYDAYAPFIAEGWLKAVFAEAKIVNGVGDPEKWASLLSPSAFQALKDRVDVEFDAASPEEFGVEDTVKLRLHIKNVKTLIVKVFEVNTLNYYLERGEEVSTDLDLDGLVPNHERTVEYDEAPQRRVARDFEFPEIEKRRGVWVVEFIGGSKSSRAVIRRGKLEVIEENASLGVGLTVVDEAHRPVPDAAVWFGGSRFECDDEGRALIPFSTDPGRRTAVVETAAGFASLARFEHPEEGFALQAGIRVDREALRPGATGTVVVRPVLTVAGRPVSLSRLQAVRLVLTSTDLDGVKTTTTVPGFEIGSDREATHEFRVPDRLASLEVQLRAQVKSLSQGGKMIDLVDGEVIRANEHSRSDRVDDLYLSRIGGSYVLELLGRTGEARTGQNLNVACRRSGFENPRRFTLKTNGAGAINLGALDGIEEIFVEAPGGYQRSWWLPEARRTQPGVVHAVAGEAVRVPFFGSLDRAEVALLAVGSGGFREDAFGKLALEGGFLVANGLAAGDYRLLLKESGQSVTLRVADGRKSAGHVFNAARILELQGRPPAHLASAGVAGESLVIEVANADALTRVHVVATRFLPDVGLFGSLGHAPRPGLFASRPSRLPNLFLSGRKIGDEFRYVLERRYAQRLPGNMLERPEILLNPWQVRDTEAGEESLAEGEAYKRQAPGAPAAKLMDGAQKGEQAGGIAKGQSQSIDFLANGPVEMLNLQPGEDGKIEIKLEAFVDRQHVHVLVVDPDGASYRDVALPDRGTALRDLRLLAALDPERHFTEQDTVTLLKEGETLELPDILTAQFEVFEDLKSAYRYLLAMRDDATLREFGFVVDWPTLEDDEKRAKYSKYACHELSFFLAMKDPEFFREFVAPYLGNKRDRTFLDDYLLETGLGRYFEPYDYNRLNVLERILLARRTPGRLDGIRRDLADRIALVPPDLGREYSWFSGALATGGLTFGRKELMDEAKAALGARLRDEARQTVEMSANLAAEDAEGAVRRKLGRGVGGGAADPFGAPPEEAEALALTDKKVQGLQQEAKKRFLKLAEKTDAYGDDFDAIVAGEAFYRAIETTKEWAENNYYHLAIEAHTYNLIPESKFWRDFAQHDGEGGFGSRYLGEATRNVHEMLLALAVLDLPFTAPESKTAIDGGKLTFTAGGPCIAFHREIKEAAMAENRPPLLVSQSYFRHGDRHRIENGEQVDKFITDEFVAGVVYGGQVVVTNPTSSRQRLDVLVQIPMGAIPVMGHRATATQRVAMEPYSTQRFETYFYFPAEGEFPTYPVHVSKGGEVVANAGAFTFKVVGKPSKVDETSWAHLSQWGTEEQVLEYLGTQNLHAIDLRRIAWRCRQSEEFFKKALAALDRRGIYHATLYSYGIRHDHAPAVRQFLLMEENFLNASGHFLKSELITMDPVERRAYQHLEYKPLVNNRAHVVGGERKILNERIRGQYRQFLHILSQKAALDDGDQLSTAYYLFLQDRAGEAMERLGSVNAEVLPARMQYDYFRAYASFYQAKPEEARAIAQKYANHPVDRWRERFAAVVAQADEIEGKGPEVIAEDSRDQDHVKRAAAEPSLDLEVEGTSVKLTYHHNPAVTVNYYEMDLEFLFSANPFVSSEGGGFSVVRPNRTERIQLAEDQREHRFDLPREYQAKNVLVEVIGGGRKRSAAVYANELQTAVSERFGILTVRHAKDGRALPAVYVKVYAMTGGGPKFYKDGYTDLRGKFDFASVSTSDIADASKFSVLVMSDEHGATVLEAPVPQR